MSLVSVVIAVDLLVAARYALANTDSPCDMYSTTSCGAYEYNTYLNRCMLVGSKCMACSDFSSSDTCPYYCGWTGRSCELAVACSQFFTKHECFSFMNQCEWWEEAGSCQGGVCTNTCTAGDHDGSHLVRCDDGGRKSDTDLCNFGTDCQDCGPRSLDSCPSYSLLSTCPSRCVWTGSSCDYFTYDYGIDCGTGRTQVNAYNICETAAALLHLRFDGIADTPDKPKGCYVYGDPPEYGLLQVWFNVHANGSEARHYQRLICMESTCATYTCGTLGWSKKRGVGSLVNPDESKCCEATCSTAETHGSCPEGQVCNQGSCKTTTLAPTVPTPAPLPGPLPSTTTAAPTPTTGSGRSILLFLLGIVCVGTWIYFLGKLGVLPSTQGGARVASSTPTEELRQQLLQSNREGEILMPPSYWKNQHLDMRFHERLDVDSWSRETIARIMTSTFRPTKTRDRDSQMPRSLRLLKVQRIEDSDMWHRYHKARATIKLKRRACRKISDISPGGVVKTSSSMIDDRMSEALNEVYLWHGTTPEGAFGITESDFQLNLAGSRSGTMFGNGAYFAECSSKSDEYATDGHGIYKGIYALLLCRVVCGEMFYLEKSDIPAINAAIRSGVYDSVLGDREHRVGTYREFVIFNKDVIYPEFVVLYERVYA